MMGLAEATQIIIDECLKIEGLEINIDANGAEIYWENLRVQCDEKGLQKALKAIKTLESMGAYFG